MSETKLYRDAGRWALGMLKICVRRTLSVVVIIGAVVVALGWGTNLRGKFSSINGATAADSVTGAPHSQKALLSAENPFIPAASAAEIRPPVSDEGTLPDLSGTSAWLNSVPLSNKSLRGKVVLVNFWTYSCINSLRELPYMKSWAEKYREAGLVVIGVHTPEFLFEKERGNVENAVRDLKVTYPVAIDNNYRIWRSFKNEYWPADYLVDGKGRIRYHHFGEGDYAESERIIQELLRENGATDLDWSTVRVSAHGIEAPPGGNIHSPETYIGYGRAEHFASPERVAEDLRKTYSLPNLASLNEWGLSGSWSVGAESALLQSNSGKIVFRFHSRDVHLVLNPTKNGKPVRFKVTLDGAALNADHGVDTAPDGSGEVREPRLYQLVRQKGAIEDRTVEIEFLDPGVQAFSFTFG